MFDINWDTLGLECFSISVYVWEAWGWRKNVNQHEKCDAEGPTDTGSQGFSRWSHI